MILFLILIVLLAIAGKMFLGMALEVVGAIIGTLIILTVIIVKRRKRQ